MKVRIEWSEYLKCWGEGEKSTTNSVSRKIMLQKKWRKSGQIKIEGIYRSALKRKCYKFFREKGKF